MNRHISSFLPALGHPPPTRPKRRPARGISLIEMMIALVITALLLAAVFAAFDASFSNYEENQAMVDALQGARILTHRVMTQARRASYVNVASSGQRIEIEPAGENYQYIYVYDSGHQRVSLLRMNLDTLATEDLGTVDNVVSFTVPSAQWGQNPTRLTLSLTVRAGANDVTLTRSAVPRITVVF